MREGSRMRYMLEGNGGKGGRLTEREGGNASTGGI